MAQGAGPGEPPLGRVPPASEDAPSPGGKQCDPCQPGPPRWARACGRAAATPGTRPPLRTAPPPPPSPAPPPPPAPPRPAVPRCAPSRPALTLQTPGCSQAEGEEPQGYAAVLLTPSRQRPHEQSLGGSGRALGSQRRGAARPGCALSPPLCCSRPPAGRLCPPPLSPQVL